MAQCTTVIKVKELVRTVQYYTTRTIEQYTWSEVKLTDSNLQSRGVKIKFPEVYTVNLNLHYSPHRSLSDRLTEQKLVNSLYLMSDEQGHLHPHIPT